MKLCSECKHSEADARGVIFWKCLINYQTSPVDGSLCAIPGTRRYCADRRAFASDECGPDANQWEAKDEDNQ